MYTNLSSLEDGWHKNVFFKNCNAMNAIIAMNENSIPGEALSFIPYSLVNRQKTIAGSKRNARDVLACISNARSKR